MCPHARFRVRSLPATVVVAETRLARPPPTPLPSAARAVANACAANPVALVIPCHRVIRGTGELGGYRWGVERKRALIEREKPDRLEPGVTRQRAAAPSA